MCGCVALGMILKTKKTMFDSVSLGMIIKQQNNMWLCGVGYVTKTTKQDGVVSRWVC